MARAALARATLSVSTGWGPATIGTWATGSRPASGLAGAGRAVTKEQALVEASARSAGAATTVPSITPAASPDEDTPASGS